MQNGAEFQLFRASQVANDDEEDFRNEVAEIRRQQKVHEGDDGEIRIVLEQNGYFFRREVVTLLPETLNFSQQGLGCSICRGPDTRPGIFVQSTRRGGLAAEAGIEPGDQVLDCNGVCLQRADFSEAVYLLKNQRRLDLLIRKGAAAGAVFQLWVGREILVDILYNSRHLFAASTLDIVRAEPAPPAAGVDGSGVVRLRQLLHGERQPAAAEREKCDSGEGPPDCEKAGGQRRAGGQRPRQREADGEGAREGEAGHAQEGEARCERQQVKNVHGSRKMTSIDRHSTMLHKKVPYLVNNNFVELFIIQFRLRLEERLLEEERKKLEEEQERLKREAAKLEAEKRRFAEAKSAEAAVAASAAKQNTASGGLAGALQEELRRRETNKRSVKKMAPSVPPPPPPPPAGYGTISKSGGGETPSGTDESRKNVKKTPLANLKNDKHDALMAEFKKAHKKVGI